MRLICWLRALLTLGARGHRWRMARINCAKHTALMHLHTMAGLDADCVRCGATWRDAEPVTAYSWEQAHDVEGEVYVYDWDGPTHETVA